MKNKNKYPTESALLTISFSSYTTNEIPNLQGKEQYGNIPETATSYQFYYNCNLKTVLGDLWNKYDVFNVKLEAIFFNTTAQVLAQDYQQIFHINGLNWVNNYLDYGSNWEGRVLETFTVGNMNVSTDYKGLHYISNANTLMFYKPQDPIVKLRFYGTRAGTNDLYTSGNRPEFTLSFTGVNMARTAKRRTTIPKAIRIPRVFKSSYFVLTGRIANMIDNNNTVWRFPDFNIREAMGSALFDKYEKFGLITRQVYKGSNIGLLDRLGAVQALDYDTIGMVNYSMSGLNWVRPNFTPYNPFYNRFTVFTSPFKDIHQSSATIIDTSNFNTKYNVAHQTYLNNVFRKTSSKVDLIIQSHGNQSPNGLFVSNPDSYSWAIQFYFEVIPID